MVAESSITLMGYFGEASCKEEIVKILQNCGLSLQRSISSLYTDQLSDDTPIVLCCGLPYARMGNDLIPFAGYVYGVQRDYYGAAIHANALEFKVLDGLYWPMLPKGFSNFADYIGNLSSVARSMPERNPELSEVVQDNDLVSFSRRLKVDYKSHLFGAKHNEVSWSVVWSTNNGYIRGYAAIMKNSIQLFTQHIQNLQARYGESERTIQDMCHWWKEMSLYDDAFLCVATDITNNEVIVVMVNHYSSGTKTVDCDWIAVSHDPKYRTYSLVPVACLKAAQTTMEHFGQDWDCNFGMVSKEQVLYKGSFAHLKPVIGIEIN